MFGNTSTTQQQQQFHFCIYEFDMFAALRKVQQFAWLGSKTQHVPLVLQHMHKEIVHFQPQMIAAANALDMHNIHVHVMESVDQQWVVTNLYLNATADWRQCIISIMPNPLSMFIYCS